MSMGPLGFGVGGGGGSVSAPLTLASGTITASDPALVITQTWDNGSETFTAFKVNVANTASAAASLLMDLQVGGTSKFKVSKDGVLTIPGGNVGLVTSSYLDMKIGGTIYRFTSNGFYPLQGGQSCGFNSGNLQWQHVNLYGTVLWAAPGGTADAGISRSSAGVLQINNGTPGTFRDLQVRYLDVRGTDAAAAQTATLTNGPTAGNPSEWMPVKFNGNVRYVPVWA